MSCDGISAPAAWGTAKRWCILRSELRQCYPVDTLRRQSSDLAVNVHLVNGHAQFAERLANLFRAADDHNERALGNDVLTRHLFDVIFRDRGDVFAISVQI